MFGFFFDRVSTPAAVPSNGAAEVQSTAAASSAEIERADAA